jgi:hypothetical protein
MTADFDPPHDGTDDEESGIPCPEQRRLVKGLRHG